MKIHNVYFDDALYRDMIQLHDVYLMAGRSHELLLRTSPECPVSDWEVSFEHPFFCHILGNRLILDLRDVRGERKERIVLSSKEADFSEWFLIHVFPEVRKEDLLGRYRCQSDRKKTLDLGEDGVVLDLDDLVDDLKPFAGNGFDFDPLSCRIRMRFGAQEVDGVTFAVHPDFAYSPTKGTIEGCCSLEAYSEEGRDESFLIGEGDEDGTISREAFLRE